MPFKKPYRICNKPRLNLKDPYLAITAHLKELKGCYALRVCIPGTRQQKYAVAIQDGILYIYNDDGLATETSKVLARLTLPANVQQHKIAAFYRDYGLKIVMPKAAHDGPVIRVPILSDAPATYK